MTNALTARQINNRNIKVFSGEQFIGWITLDTYLMGEARWGFKDTTGARAETGWKFQTVGECLAAVAA